MMVVRMSPINRLECSGLALSNILAVAVTNDGHKYRECDRRTSHQRKHVWLFVVHHIGARAAVR